MPQLGMLISHLRVVVSVVVISDLLLVVTILGSEIIHGIQFLVEVENVCSMLVDSKMSMVAVVKVTLVVVATPLPPSVINHTIVGEIVMGVNTAVIVVKVHI
jgi:hypothetical protein